MRKHTAFYTRFAKSSYGETLTTLRVNHLRYILVYTSIYWYVPLLTCFQQHAHIENIKTVANLTNNKDVFMCILQYHARVGYLQTYEALLKEIIVILDPLHLPQINMQWRVQLLQTAISMYPVRLVFAIHPLSP